MDILNTSHLVKAATNVNSINNICVVSPAGWVVSHECTSTDIYNGTNFTYMTITLQQNGSYML